MMTTLQVLGLTLARPIAEVEVRDAVRIGAGCMPLPVGE